MIKIKGINKIKNIAQRPVYLFLLLFLIDLMVGGILFWQTILSPKSSNSKPQSIVVLNKISLDNFIQDQKEREENFQKNEDQTSRDIFLGFVEISTPAISPTSSATSTATSTQG